MRGSAGRAAIAFRRVDGVAHAWCVHSEPSRKANPLPCQCMTRRRLSDIAGWALTLCLLIDAAYVGSLYLARRGARDSPDVIRSRIASTICCALVSWSPLAVVILAGDGQAG